MSSQAYSPAPPSLVTKEILTRTTTNTVKGLDSKELIERET